MKSKGSTTLNNYYSEIEKLSVSKFHIKIFPPMEDITNMVEEERFYIHIEYWAQLALNEKSIIKKFGSNKESVIGYLKERINTTSNDILKAKYNNFIFILSKNNIDCQEAIKFYQKALLLAFKDTQREFYELSVDNIFEKILDLSLKIEYQIDELKEQIKNYLTNNSIADRLKTRLFLSVKEKDIFSNKESAEFPSIFISLAQSCSDKIWIEHNLKIALFYATKNYIHNQQEIQKINELLGDNECENISPEDDSNILIPYQNERIYEKIIEYYEKAKCVKKLKQIQEAHSKNKKNKKYILKKIECKISKELIEYQNNLLEEISNMQLIDIVVSLISCKMFFFIPNQKLVSIIEENKGKYFYQKHFIPVQGDRNFNHKKSNKKSDNKYFFFDKYSCYNIVMQDRLDFIFNFVLNCIQKKKLTYKKLHYILEKHSVFGEYWTKNFPQNEISYTWLSMIDVGLENFFVQCNQVFKEKIPDWRICIDVLTPKFEGILRDVLELNGATITKFNNENTSLFTLEYLIRPESSPDIRNAFFKSFDDDDLNLFQYTFSSIAQCRNIRNEVAHCFYLPQHYTYQVAILVVLCILRLAKFQPNTKKDK